jgi:adenine-specific DNA-methyltransferase
MSQITNSEQELLARISELETEIKQLKKQKKYGLVWEDHTEDVVLQCQNNVPILKEVKSRKIVDKDTTKPTNILIEGDNYHALSVLNYTHRGKIDVIYIDPPYNTGSNSWRYNNDYVNKDDDFRHSKWVSLMNTRLRLAKELLTSNGALICAIDENELNTLGLLLQEIFHGWAIDCVTVIHNPGGIQGTNFSYNHEYVYFVYPKKSGYIKPEQRSGDDLTPFRDWGKENSKREGSPNCFYPIISDGEKIIDFGEIPEKDFHPKLPNELKDGLFYIWPIDSKGIERRWRFARDTIETISQELVIKKQGDQLSVLRGKINYIRKTVWDDVKYNANIYGTQLLSKILPDKFPFPKSLHLVRECLISVEQNKNAITLDFFAGSGTTGHAVMELNKQDGGNRQFILCTNNENNICEEVTYERIKRVMKGYKNKKGEEVEGLGGNLRYFKTELCDVGKLSRVTDDKKLALTYRVGGLLALKENTFEETEHTDHWQIFMEHDACTAVYFSEDKTLLHDLIKKLGDYQVPVKLYVFSWSKNEYGSELSAYQNISVSDIPEPILAVYREINNI